MPDFLLELLSEEIPARMQAKASQDLARLFSDQLSAAGLAVEAVETYATPRRLALIARNLPAETEPVREETKGPRSSAQPQALDGFLRKTGLTQEQLEERDGVYYAVVEKPGRPTASVLAEAVPAMIRDFPWPKSMRWGEASASTESPRWVRPLQGIVALLGEEIVEFEIAGIRSGAASVGHRFHHPGAITIGSAADYVEKLNACRVIVDPAERSRIIAEGARAAAEGAGLTLVEDDGLLAENAGLTEWPVPLLGSFDPAYLDVPRDVIQLTMRTNQKYFACTYPPRDGEGDRSPEASGGGGAVPGSQPPPSALRADTSPSRGGLAPNFVCTANIEASDGGEAIVKGNERVLSARLADARFFWEQDLKVPLEEQAKKLGDIVFHEKLGTVADKVERVAKLARWLVEEGAPNLAQPPLHPPSPSAAAGPPPRPGEDLAALAERAARLCKADLVTQMVGEFPELQGAIGGHLARVQGEPDAVADAIRDHYKPAGQGDQVPTAPVTVAVSLADKLDTVAAFLSVGLLPSGTRDPFAIRRALLAIISILTENAVRLPLLATVEQWVAFAYQSMTGEFNRSKEQNDEIAAGNQQLDTLFKTLIDGRFEQVRVEVTQRVRGMIYDAEEVGPTEWLDLLNSGRSSQWAELKGLVLSLTLDRLKVQQREAGVRHDLIDAVFALGGEDDLVRLLARVKALQAFVETPEGADLLAGYKRAANILRKENWSSPAKAGAQSESQLDPGLRREAVSEQAKNKSLSYTPETEEAALIAALDLAEPRARAAVEAEDFEGAMAALASLRAPVDSFFDKVTVNDENQDKRAARLSLLARMRDAVHRVADFSKIEG